MRVLRAVVCAFAFAATASVAAQAAERPTRLTTYVPVIPAGKAVPGSCWTRSIAAPNRTDAYRCMVKSSIYDPCFAT